MTDEHYCFAMIRGEDSAILQKSALKIGVKTIGQKDKTSVLSVFFCAFSIHFNKKSRLASLNIVQIHYLYN